MNVGSAPPPFSCEIIQWIALFLKMKICKLEKKQKTIANFKNDVDILLLILSITAKIRSSHIPQIQRQIRRPTTRLGNEYI
ncbi:unnamed protein product [Thlaspi arvense]|uniref:Uncharacterized protein n=1 Tax=Thlaspi arvense TaxID=13288 RepID=A0AAU9S9J7_THLAR|nr:unnamed protein product [Thlaspi arvense]